MFIKNWVINAITKGDKSTVINEKKVVSTNIVKDVNEVRDIIDVRNYLITNNIIMTMSFNCIDSEGNKLCYNNVIRVCGDHVDITSYRVSILLSTANSVSHGPRIWLCTNGIRHKQQNYHNSEEHGVCTRNGLPMVV